MPRLLASSLAEYIANDRTGMHLLYMLPIHRIHTHTQAETRSECSAVAVQRLVCARSR